jgi:hypothetical protein
VFHIHVREIDDYDEAVFRDYLISDPETAAGYAALRRKLKDEFEHDRDGYTSAKTEFIGRGGASGRLTDIFAHTGKTEERPFTAGFMDWITAK